MAAIFTVLHKAQVGDVVVAPDKGHETYQILENETVHFDNKEVVAEYFKSQPPSI